MGMNNFTFNTTSGIRFGSGMSKICVEEISKKLGPIFYSLQIKV